VDDLVRWLTAQLDADEEQARAAAEEYGADWYYDDGFVLARREDDMVATGSQDFLERKQGVFIAAHDPARVLRDIDAKRKLLAECQLAEAEASYPDWMGGYSSGLDYAVQLVAAEYADREGYDPEWAPRSQWGPPPPA